MDMEFIQAFNPLYAFPIVTVVFCVVIVYVFGFKSPVQPPSFEGLDDEKKYSKKRKVKEAQKQSKSLSNGKANGIVVSKGKSIEVSEKKEVSDHVIEKLSNHEKLSKGKKAVKKVKSQRENKIVQGKKENFSSDEPIEDGWVQLVSKKGRKNRKKDENIALDVHPNAAELIVKNTLEPGENIKIEESQKHTVSDIVTVVEKDTSLEKIQHIKDKSMKKSSNIITPPVSVPESSINLTTLIENTTTVDENRNESQPNIPTIIEESSKSKKKKKKQAVISSEVTVTKVTPPTLPSEVKAKIISPALPHDINSKLVENSSPIPEKLEFKSGDVRVNPDIDLTSNVAFDELAGLYPEAKEKKKKKVRRDH